jgi:hypothetical protein
MMNHPVPEGGGDSKIPVFPQYIPAIDKILLKAE